MSDDYRNVRFIGGPLDGTARRVAISTHLHAHWPDSDTLSDAFTYTLSRTVSGEWVAAEEPLATYQATAPAPESLPDQAAKVIRDKTIQHWRRALAREGHTAVEEPVATLEDHPTQGRRWLVSGSVLR